MKSANGVLILILGIISFVGFGCLTGIPAWIMGNNALAQIDRGEADSSERGLVNAGRILGMVATILGILGIIAAILMFALGIGIAATSTAGTGPR